MSFAMMHDAVMRAGAAALDERDAPYGPHEKYPVDDERAAFLTRLAKLVMIALGATEEEKRKARIAERKAKPRGAAAGRRPKGIPPKLAGVGGRRPPPVIEEEEDEPEPVIEPPVNGERGGKEEIPS